LSRIGGFCARFQDPAPKAVDQAVRPG
jgi:hypothetical protein